MKKLYLLCVMVGVLGFSSCQEWLTVQPKTQITPDELFATPQGFEDALYGCYLLLEPLYDYKGPMVSGTIEYLACAWDVALNSQEDLLGLHEYSDNGVDNVMGDIFQRMYKVIANVSTLISAIREQDGVLNEKEYAKCLGEALGLRAFCHLELMRLWGPIPSEVKEGKKYLPFVEQMQIQPYEYLDYRTYMNKVLRDLTEAEGLLKSLLTMMAPIASQINYYTILGLQARCGFWMGENERAMAYGERLLVTDTIKYFPLHQKGTGNSGSVFESESLWSYPFYSTSSISLAQSNDESYVLNELFGDAEMDDRLNQWKKDESSGGEGKLKLIKYNVEKNPGAGVLDKVYGRVTLLRISEIYLMMMELTDLVRANELYAEFANARGINPITFATRGELMRQLELEYRREFIGEGQLFFAYKRWNLSNMPRCSRGCGEAAYVPPIPKKEFDLGN